MADSTVVREDKIPGLTQTDCLTGIGSEGDRGPCAPCQSARYVSKWVSAVQAYLFNILLIITFILLLIIYFLLFCNLFKEINYTLKQQINNKE